MSEYQQFVKQAMQQMAGSNLSPQQKMKKIGAAWRKSGRATTKKRTNKKKTTRKSGGAMALRGGSMGLRGGSAGHIHLDNGVPLHPQMMGSGFWKDFAKGFKMPFQAIGKAANSDVGKAVMMAAPFLI